MHYCYCRHYHSVVCRSCIQAMCMASASLLQYSALLQFPYTWSGMQAFLQQGNKLCSCSKDCHIRVWDLDTQHCSQTLVGFGSEVWALAVDPSQTRLVSGSADTNLQVYTIARQDVAEDGSAEPGQRDTLKLLGTSFAAGSHHTIQVLCGTTSSVTVGMT